MPSPLGRALLLFAGCILRTLVVPPVVGFSRRGSDMPGVSQATWRGLLLACLAFAAHWLFAACRGIACTPVHACQQRLRPLPHMIMPFTFTDVTY